MSITYASSSAVVTGSLGQVVWDPQQVAVVSENSAYTYASEIATLLKVGFKLETATTATSGAGAFVIVPITAIGGLGGGAPFTASQYSLTGSDLSTIYIYSASDAPVPADVPPIYFFATGSTLAESVTNLSAEINNSLGNEIVSSAVVSNTSLKLTAVEWGTRGNFIQFQSGSTQFLFASGATDTGKTYEAILIKPGQKLTHY